MTEVEQMTLFEKLKPIAIHLSKKASIRYGHPFQEVLDEAMFCLAEKVCNWDWYFDPSKAKAETWVYWGLQKQLITFCTRRRHSCGIPFSTYDTEDSAYEPTHHVSFLGRLLHELGEEAQFLVKTIVHAPIEIVDELTISSRRRGREAVRKWLADRCGWSADRIDKAWKEVEECLV